MKDDGQQNFETERKRVRKATRTENDRSAFLISSLLYFVSPMSIVVETLKVSLKIETVVAR
jgi:hypothetical protein